MSQPPPEWMHREDGSRAPLEPEAIARDLFALMEARGGGDSFLARELTDAAMHFLSLEGDAEPPEALVREVVARVVRELGYPQLAADYADLPAHAPESLPESPPSPPPDPFPQALLRHASPAELTAIAVRSLAEAFSDRHVYPRDLLSAAEQGLIALGDRHHPLELSCVGVELSRDADALDRALDARGMAGTRVRLLHPEQGRGAPRRVLRELAWVPAWTGLQLELHLNHREPPEVGVGLFAESGRARPRRDPGLWLGRTLPEGIALHWHLREDDLTLPRAEQFLNTSPLVLHLRGTGPPPDLLSSVAVDLAVLLEQLGGEAELDLYLKKLGSLCRLARGVGLVRRRFLRRHARERTLRGFRLERAALEIRVRGLAGVARALAGSHAGSPSRCAEMQVRLLAAMRQALDADRPGTLPCLLLAEPQLHREGLPLPQQVRLAAQAHHAAGAGVFRLPPAEDGSPWTAGALLELIRRCRDAGIDRLA